MQIFTVAFTPSTNPPGKLADAELIFTDQAGALAGLKLIGFGIWERPRSGQRNVTFPARTYAVNGERRSFALLRPTTTAAQDAIRVAILDQFAAYERTNGTVDADGFRWAPSDQAER